MPFRQAKMNHSESSKWGLQTSNFIIKSQTGTDLELKPSLISTLTIHLIFSVMYIGNDAKNPVRLFMYSFVYFLCF